MQKKENILTDVCIIRPILIFLLVVYHSFIIYQGGWSEPIGFEPNRFYWWISKISYSFMLEAFVMISGYVFALTLQKKNPSFKMVINDKFKRLIIPSLIFSLIYYIIFYDHSDFFTFKFFINILSGCGHMWFLPMLFWATIIGFLFNKIKYPEWLKLLVLLGCVALSFLPIPFGISSALYYALYFYVGILIFKHKEYIINKTCNNLTISTLLGGGFLLLFIFGTLINRDIIMAFADNASILVKAISLLIGKYIIVIYALTGVIFIYVLTNTLLKAKRLVIGNWLKDLNATCFGIYLFQQFILQILYYKTSLPAIVGAYWLPWVGLIVTLIISYILTKLSLKTRLGKQLM